MIVEIANLATDDLAVAQAQKEGRGRAEGAYLFVVVRVLAQAFAVGDRQGPRQKRARFVHSKLRFAPLLLVPSKKPFADDRMPCKVSTALSRTSRFQAVMAENNWSDVFSDPLMSTLSRN